MFSFLGIGAQKAGTTWLYTHLRQHPDLAFPNGKEVHFWNNAHDSEDVAVYLEGFEKEPRCAGEITPAYAILPECTIAELYGYAPGLRLIYLIRNPVDRAWSSALMALKRAEMSLDEASDQWFVDHFRSSGSLTRGDYASCMRAWLSVFPTEQLMVRRFEGIRSDPVGLLNDCFRHLGVDPRSAEDLQADRVDQVVFAGARAPVRESLRPTLASLYRPLIIELQAALEQDFTDWLDALDWAA